MPDNRNSALEDMARDMRAAPARVVVEAMGWARPEQVRDAIARLVDARASLRRLEDDHALQGVDEYHDAMRAVSYAAEALGLWSVHLDTLARAKYGGRWDGQADMEREA